VPSPAIVLLAASLMQMPFGSSLETRLPGSSSVPANGSIVGSFLVVASHQSDDGATVVTLRPLALGELAVPLPGAEPSQVEVDPALAADAGPRPLIIPAAPPFPWGAAVLPLAAVAALALAAHLLRRRRRPDPLAALEAALRVLASPGAWAAEGAADRLARSCRTFLEAVIDAPCGAMTTREVSRLLAARLEARFAVPFARGLVLADEARFAGAPLQAEAAAEIVHLLLAAAPEVALVTRGQT
jgi:hypothetical protein